MEGDTSKKWLWCHRLPCDKIILISISETKDKSVFKVQQILKIKIKNVIGSEKEKSELIFQNVKMSMHISLELIKKYCFQVEIWLQFWQFW